MSYTYSGDPANSDLDNYRFIIGDTGELADPADTTPTTGFILTDEEMQFVLDNFTIENQRLYYFYNGIVNNLARYPKRKLGPQEEDPTNQIKYYQEQVQYYRKLTGIGASITQPVYSSEDKIFTVGMHDNDT